MTPYLIANQWINLDHVLAIDKEPKHLLGSLAIVGFVKLAFNTEPYAIKVGEVDSAGYEQRKTMVYIESLNAARMHWDCLIDAWKARSPLPSP